MRYMKILFLLILAPLFLASLAILVQYIPDVIYIHIGYFIVQVMLITFVIFRDGYILPILGGLLVILGVMVLLQKRVSSNTHLGQ